MNQDSDAFGSDDAAADYAYARQLVQAYFSMLTKGCQQMDCTNMYCCSNPHTTTLSATDAAIVSIYLATKAPAPLCVGFDGQQQELAAAGEQFASPADVHQQSTTAEQSNEVEIHELQQAQVISVDELTSPAGNHQISPTVEQTTNQASEGGFGEKPHEVLEEPHITNQEEQCPETAEVEVPKCEHPDNNIVQLSGRDRNSTPRQRLSTAVQLDQGLNKGLKKPATITRVVVQPKHNQFLHSDANQSDAKNAMASEQQQEESSKQPASPAKNTFKHRLSRPKQKLFDAIKKSFSRTRKAPLGSV